MRLLFRRVWRISANCSSPLMAFAAASVKTWKSNAEEQWRYESQYESQSQWKSQWQWEKAMAKSNGKTWKQCEKLWTSFIALKCAALSFGLLVHVRRPRWSRRKITFCDKRFLIIILMNTETCYITLSISGLFINLSALCELWSDWIAVQAPGSLEYDNPENGSPGCGSSEYDSPKSGSPDPGFPIRRVAG